VTAPSILVEYSELPLSANNMFYNAPGGGRRLTTEAKNWKARFSAHVAQHHLFTIQSMRQSVAAGMVLAVEITLRFPLKEVVSLAWPKRYKKDTWVGKKGTKSQRLKKAGERKAESRYKRMDVSNRYKLVEDAIAETLGVDDRFNFVVSGKKLVDEGNPGLTVLLTLDDPRAFGVPEEFLGDE
tara:strand:+ start:1092 stop:1640 length:549 start_codon:yes stop_codon:yes gene_type:complete